MSDPYDALAPHYREYSGRKANYLKAVDDFILRHVDHPPNALLDVGAGDGVRGMSLAKAMGAKRIVLSDQSDEMVALCRACGADDVWQCQAQQLPDYEGQFDIILCLWNVLGHLPDRAARVAAFQSMASKLAPNGRIFFDVNNRHNRSSYGYFRVTARRLLDYVCPDERRGDASFDWQIGGKVFPGKGHLFTETEIRSIVVDSGLKIVERVAIDYESGRQSNNAFDGQLVYILAR
jgi:2-polyprenyl-3-methyl-5-hydroxy-6-metoxy-1,4-benzoquinol methylase